MSFTDKASGRHRASGTDTSGRHRASYIATAVPVVAQPTGPDAPKLGLLRNRKVVAFLSAPALVAGLVVSIVATAGAADSTTMGMYHGTERPALASASDSSAVDLGTRFTVGKSGSIVAARYFKSEQNTGTHVATLWNANGIPLATATFTDETDSGWQTVDFAKSVPVAAGKTYVISYRTETGHYAAQQQAFSNGKTIGSSIIRGNSGVFHYGDQSAFPTLNWNFTSYFVDALFTTASQAASSSSSKSKSKSSSSASGSASSSASSSSAQSPVGAVIPGPSASGSSSTSSSSASSSTAASSSAASSSAASAGAISTAGFPNASNTGYRNANCPNGLTPWSGGSIQSNQTYSCIDFNGGIDVGSTGAAVANVTFYGCRFHGIAVNEKLVGLWGDNISFNYSSFEPGVSSVPTTGQVPFNQSYQYGIQADGAYNTYVGQLTVTNSDFWGFGNAIDIDGSTQAKPQVFRNNWIHDASDDGGANYHTDGIGTMSGHGSGSYVVIDHNTIESVGNTNGLAFQAGSYDHFTITNNLFGGFGYTVALLGGATYTTFTGNVFSTRLPVTFGPTYPANFATTTGSVWRQNRWLVPSGASWGNAAHSGWYWTPNADATANDSAFVSQSDFTG